MACCSVWRTRSVARAAGGYSGNGNPTGFEPAALTGAVVAPTTRLLRLNRNGGRPGFYFLCAFRIEHIIHYPDTRSGECAFLIGRLVRPQLPSFITTHGRPRLREKSQPLPPDDFQRVLVGRRVRPSHPASAFVDDIDHQVPSSSMHCRTANTCRTSFPKHSRGELR